MGKSTLFARIHSFECFRADDEKSETATAAANGPMQNQPDNTHEKLIRIISVNDDDVRAYAGDNTHEAGKHGKRVRVRAWHDEAKLMAKMQIF